MSSFDFTSLHIENADGPDLAVDNKPWAQDGVSVRAYFGDLSTHLTAEISEYTFAVGCFAWLTHAGVIDAFSRLKFGCQIICQKEDFLRPDSGASRGWKSQLSGRYSSLKCLVGRHDCGSVAGMPLLSVCKDEGGMDAIRCVGNHNSDRCPAFPRMHHKFVVFCGIERLDETDETGCPLSLYGKRPVPLAVWTGSFNPTSNGTKSRENAVLIRSPEISLAYFREWYQMFAMSESLDWESEWCSPEYRIGT
jgi:hypothetical protein